MLTFEAETHTYRWNGKVVPSVTQILKAAGLSDFSMVKPDVLEAARARGVAVHKMIELHNAGTLDMGTVDERLLPYLQAWMVFCADHSVSVKGSEFMTYSKLYGYAGTVDLHLVVDGENGIWDIKTGAVLPATALQLAAYSNCYIHTGTFNILKRRALKLSDDGRYSVVSFESENDFNVFLSALNLYNWKKANSK